MKRLSIILLLLYSLNNATAQNSSVNKPDSSKTFHFQDAVSGITRKNPLYIIDGKIISDTLSKHILQDIDPNDIAEISILRHAAATALYGAEGANGVVIVKTKRYQKRDTIGKDKMPAFAINNEVLFIVDGQPSKNKLSDIKSDDILSIDILKRAKGIDPSLQPDSKTVIVTTKTFATSQYQKKFSSFSKRYGEYLTQHQNNDEDFIYVLNGVPVLSNNKIDIKKLYEIPAKEIKEVIYKEKLSNINNIKPLVIITTKQ